MPTRSGLVFHTDNNQQSDGNTMPSPDTMRQRAKAHQGDATGQHNVDAGSSGASSSWVAAALAIFFTLAGCCINMFALEMMVKRAPTSGNIVTFAQFLFITCYGFIFTMGCGTVKRQIPLKNYAFLVSLFFVVQWLNNYALAFNISAPLHMIFRAGSLIASLTLNVLILGKKYTWEKISSVLLVTAGIVVCTAASAGDVAKGGSKAEEADNYYWWFIGIAMLSTSLFLSARMGIYQELLYKEFGKHPSESLFFNHALPICGFALFYNDIVHHIGIFNQSEPFTLLGFSLPILWWLLALNTLSQYLCIKSVFVLTTECSSLTVTLVVTLRKFLSLIFSIWYFSNPFTLAHWIGTGCVFGGTLIFTDVHRKIFARLKTD